MEESGCYIYCGTDSGDIVKLVVTDGGGGAVADSSAIGIQVQTCAVVKTGKVVGGAGGKKDVNAGKFAGGALGNLAFQKIFED